MKNQIKLLLGSMVILLFVIILALVITIKDDKKENNNTSPSSSNTVTEEKQEETEAREVVYLIFPTSQNTTTLEIKNVHKVPDSYNLASAGFESDYKDTSNIKHNEEDKQDTIDTTSDDSTLVADNTESSDDTNMENPDENQPDDTPDEDQPDETKPDEDNPDQTPDEDKPDEGTPDETVPDNGQPDEGQPENPDTQVAETPEQPSEPALPATPDTGSPIAAMYLKYAASSSGNLDYIVYVPANATASTPIFMFLHGNGEVGKDMEKAVTRYAFLQRLKDGSWQPGCIIICPIAKKKSHWAAEVNNLNIIIDEVTTSYGGSRNNMYISGASAGADAMTRIASQIPFQGAIYMAGHMNSGGYSVSSFLSLWSGKPCYYYRDNLAGGGYGYSKAFVDSCIANAPLYGVRFSWTDLNWNHSIGLVDATFLPSSFIDANGRPCQNGIGKLIYGQ